MNSRSDFIPLMSPNITESDINEVVKVLRSGMLVQGANVLDLEKSFSAYLDIPYASALSNGTATLHLALSTLGIGKDDEVIVPAFSYMATANVVELVGATPVFVDIDIRTFNIDISKIELAVTDKTRAIIPVHEFGLAADMAAIMKIANKYNLYVIEDAACALGATENGQHVGTFGDFGSFSLHPRKAISSGEGGVLVTSSAEWDRQIKILRNHGIEILDGKMEFVIPGYNYRMTDFQAALVNSQMKRLEEIIEYKQKLSGIYFEQLHKSDMLLPDVPEGKKHTWQTFHVVLQNGVDRDKLILKLKEGGIGTNYGAQCMPYMKVYKEKYNLNCEQLFPNALRAYKQGLALPIYERLTEETVLRICEKINELI